MPASDHLPYQCPNCGVVIGRNEAPHCDTPNSRWLCSEIANRQSAIDNSSAPPCGSRQFAHHSADTAATTDLAELRLAKARLDWLVAWLEESPRHRIQAPWPATPYARATKWVLLEGEKPIATARGCGELLDWAQSIWPQK